MATINEKSKTTLGLAVIVIGGGAWWLSAFYAQVQSMREEVTEMRLEQKASSALLASLASDQRLLTRAVESLQRPVVRTRAEVRELRKDLIFAHREQKPRFEVCRPCNLGPFSMNETGR